MVWKNGEIDERELVIFKRGKNATDGDWFHGLTPATYARHLELVRIAKDRTGRTLEISEGYGAYRPVEAQIRAREIYGNGAAFPRTSSHGGYWEKRETMAMDYVNWSWVYNGDREAFYADCRKAGLEPGMISKGRGYPDEPWHVIDGNPRVMPAFASNNSTPFTPDTSEEDDMRIIYSQHLDREFLLGDGGITHLIGGASAALNAIGIPGNRHVNQLGKDDFRKVVEAYGLSYERTRLLNPGERLQRDTRDLIVQNGVAVLDAGNVPWGERWA